MSSSTRLLVEWVLPARLFPNPSNPRKNDAAVPHVVASLRRFGFQQPIVAKRSGEVIAGHTRLRAALEIGLTEVPVVWFDGNDLDAAAYNIADNRTHEFATWDEPALGKILEQLRAEDSLEGVGYSNDEIDQLLLELGDGTAPNDCEDPGPQEPPEEPITRLGDLWILGNHRLLCGDSTKPEDVARVLNGEKAALLATDPPYCVSYTGMDRPIHDGKPSGKDWSHVYREVDIKDLGEFLDGVMKACLPHVRDDAAIYMWHAHVQQPTIAAVFERHGILLHQVLVWVKPTATFGHSYYRWRHEPCAFGWKQGHKPKHGFGQLDSIWEADWDGKARISTFHPCLHPDELVLTEAGYRRICAIQGGDRVFAADGAFHAVTQVSSHPYTSTELIRIVAKGGNVATLASDNHPFLIYRPKRVGKRVERGEVLWSRADEVRVGDFTMTPVLMEPASDPFPDRDEEFWFLFGLYLAQGSLQSAGHGPNRYPAFALHRKRTDLVRRIRARFESVGEYEQSEYSERPTQGVTVMAFDSEVGALFEQLGRRRAADKRLAPVLLSLPREKRRAILMGWLEGDGCRVQGRDYWQGKTVSADLAAQLSLLGESIGFRTDVFRYDPSDQPIAIDGRRIKHRLPEFHLYFYDVGTDVAIWPTRRLEHDGRIYKLRYVTRVERVPYVGDVWNLTVEGSPTFQTSVGMSHNTSKPTRLFEIPMEVHTASGAIVLEPFSGSASQIMAAEKLGRRCRAIELSPHFVDGDIARWQKATGKLAVLDGDGRTFDAIAAERGGAR